MKPIRKRLPKWYRNQKERQIKSSSEQRKDFAEELVTALALKEGGILIVKIRQRLPWWSSD